MTLITPWRNLKFWFKGLKYWQKGSVMGFGTGILYFVIALSLAEIDAYYKINLDFIAVFILFTIGLGLILTATIYQLFPNSSDVSIILVWLSSLMVYTVIGALIGLIIGKVKGNLKTLIYKYH